MYKCFTMLLVSLSLVACDRVDPNSPLGQRKAIFKEMLKTSEDMGGMLRGRLPFDGGKFAAGAVKLDGLAHAPWQHFPQVKDDGQSSARPQVWERQARFHELARQLEDVTGELVGVTRAQPLEAARLKSPMDKVEAACKACHTEFRNH
ncbi:cytochrome c [Pseudomonas guariconensis]|uniref:c-type cytochrome n=1 Tax=Pseudomonas TaxID=286 RepID=UPI001CE3EAB9|nr:MULTISPECIES: cytochrome c [Pseudomonas]MCO7639971.1 cytochrome c [Pseudomonas sp. S 311-6]MCO7515903.1 cytochrome c [Pseudomonas putida]MCO7567987.1 cytochrome c [Pseudomonas mosselii]MCO7594344.1 cytochrome c [Pseudomonas guariconensis]MCO7607143.1 cytochrome c [Pseudomonas guariconensis]